MKNRTLPYGYQCCNGITVLHPQESEIVKRICKAYLNGQSLLTIATWLNEEQIEYMPGVIGWNKARLKRIIEDERYLGKEPYPTILDEETHTAMQQIKEKRNTQKNTDRKADIFQISVPIKCPNCGKRLIRKVNNQCKIPQRWICENKNCRLLIAIADSDLLKAVSSTLAGITPESIRINEPSNNEPSIEVRRLNNDISRMLGALQIDKDALRKKMMECISQKYTDLDADIKENGQHAQCEMTILQSSANGCFLRRLSFIAFSFLQERLGQFGEKQHDQCKCKNTHRNIKSRTGSLQRKPFQRAAHQVTDKHRANRCSKRIGSAAKLQKLIAFLAASAKRIQHWIDNRVQHTHREACHKRANQINGKDSGFKRARQKHQCHACQPDKHCRYRRKAIPFA